MKNIKMIVAVFITIMLGLVSPAMSQEVTTDDIIKRQKDGENMVKGMGGSFENQNQKQADIEAQRLQQKYQSDEFQNKLQSETNRIKKFFDTGVWEKPAVTGKADPGSHYATPSGMKSSKKGHLRGDERIYVLISSSMPIDTIRNYAYSLARGKDPNVKMMLRGMVPTEPGDKAPMVATVKFVTTIITGKEGCLPGIKGCEKLLFPAGVQIDPLIFRRYGITDNVPAIIYARGVKTMDFEKSEGSEYGMDVKDFYVLYGDASLEYAIEVFRREMKARNNPTDGLEKLLAVMRGDGQY